MYKVLYRKWRPSVFEDVVGQPQVTVTLRNELSAGRISHAYLFTGSRGTGKTTCAKILARAVNCLSPVNGDPCGCCEICQEAAKGFLLDIVEIDAASNNGVDHIRALSEEASFMPAKGKYRVYIIDEVHMLSQGAFNALLKTLEEPPSHVVFILATTEVHKLPATILSRCQRLDFRRIPPADIAARLQYIAGEEGASLDDEAALIIARLADGALRDALSLLDQCFGISTEVTAQVVSQAVGIVGRERLAAITDGIIRNDSEAVLSIVDELHNGSKNMLRLSEELLSYLRDVMLFKTMKSAGTVLALSQDEMNVISEQAKKFRLSFLIHCIDSVQSAMEKMSRGSDQRVTFEMTLIQLCSPELDTSVESLVRRIDALEREVRQLKSGAVQIPAGAETAEVTEETSPAEPVEEEKADREAQPSKPARKSGTQTTEDISQNAEPFVQWPEVLAVLKEKSRNMSAAFADSDAYISGKYILIAAKREIAFDLLRHSEENRHSVKDSIREITGKDYNIGPYRPTQKSVTEDPLMLLAQKAEQAGIEVIKK